VDIVPHLLSLCQLPMTRFVLDETGVYQTVQAFTSHSNKTQVAVPASRLLRQWRRLLHDAADEAPIASRSAAAPKAAPAKPLTAAAIRAATNARSGMGGFKTASTLPIPGEVPLADALFTGTSGALSSDPVEGARPVLPAEHTATADAPEAAAENQGGTAPAQVEQDPLASDSTGDAAKALEALAFCPAPEAAAAPPAPMDQAVAPPGEGGWQPLAPGPQAEPVAQAGQGVVAEMGSEQLRDVMRRGSRVVRSETAGDALAEEAALLASIAAPRDATVISATPRAQVPAPDVATANRSQTAEEPAQVPATGPAAPTEPNTALSGITRGLSKALQRPALDTSSSMAELKRNLGVGKVKPGPGIPDGFTGMSVAGAWAAPRGRDANRVRVISAEDRAQEARRGPGAALATVLAQESRMDNVAAVMSRHSRLSPAEEAAAEEDCGKDALAQFQSVVTALSALDTAKAMRMLRDHAVGLGMAWPSFEAPRGPYVTAVDGWRCSSCDQVVLDAGPCRLMGHHVAEVLAKRWRWGCNSCGSSQDRIVPEVPKGCGRCGGSVVPTPYAGMDAVVEASRTAPPLDRMV